MYKLMYARHASRCVSLAGAHWTVWVPKRAFTCHQTSTSPMFINDTVSIRRASARPCPSRPQVNRKFCYNDVVVFPCVHTRWPFLSVRVQTIISLLYFLINSKLKFLTVTQYCCYNYYHYGCFLLRSSRVFESCLSFQRQRNNNKRITEGESLLFHLAINSAYSLLLLV